jgi:hypothetical protein
MQELRNGSSTILAKRSSKEMPYIRWTDNLSGQQRSVPQYSIMHVYLVKVFTPFFFHYREQGNNQASHGWFQFWSQFEVILFENRQKLRLHTTKRQFGPCPANCVDFGDHHTLTWVAACCTKANRPADHNGISSTNWLDYVDVNGRLSIYGSPCHLHLCTADPHLH